MKRCGLQTILKPMLDDLNKLASDGITNTMDGIEQTIHAALATFSADNLSAHMLAGFTMSFNSHRVCHLSHGNIYRDEREILQGRFCLEAQRHMSII